MFNILLKSLKKETFKVAENDPKDMQRRKSHFLKKSTKTQQEQQLSVLAEPQPTSFSLFLCLEKFHSRQPGAQDSFSLQPRVKGYRVFPRRAEHPHFSFHVTDVCGIAKFLVSAIKRLGAPFFCPAPTHGKRPYLCMHDTLRTLRSPVHT